MARRIYERGIWTPIPRPTHAATIGSDPPELYVKLRASMGIEIRDILLKIDILRRDDSENIPARKNISAASLESSDCPRVARAASFAKWMAMSSVRGSELGCRVDPVELARAESARAERLLEDTRLNKALKEAPPIASALTDRVICDSILIASSR